MAHLWRQRSLAFSGHGCPQSVGPGPLSFFKLPVREKRQQGYPDIAVVSGYIGQWSTSFVGSGFCFNFFTPAFLAAFAKSASRASNPKFVLAKCGRNEKARSCWIEPENPGSIRCRPLKPW
jgi:hypothetical protein